MNASNIMAFPLHAGSDLPPLTIFGRSLRPVSFASYRVALEAQSALILMALATEDGEDLTVDCTTADNLFAVLTFVFIHSAPVEQVTSAARGTAEEFAEGVENFGAGISGRSISREAVVSSAHVAAIQEFTSRAVKELPELQALANAS